MTRTSTCASPESASTRRRAPLNSPTSPVITTTARCHDAASVSAATMSAVFTSSHLTTSGGTSLPELASSVVSLLKGKAEMALGNVIGSNIANILLILGISATIHPLTMGGITLTDILVVVLSSLLLFMAAFTFRSKKLDRWEGAIFLAIYIAYIWYLVR